MQKSTYPHLMTFRKACILKTPKEIIQELETNEDLKNELKQLKSESSESKYYTKIRDCFAELCVRSFEITRYIFISESDNLSRKIIRAMLLYCSPLTKAKIFSHYSNLSDEEQEERELWKKELWNRWKSDILVQRKRSPFETFAWLDEELKGKKRANSRHENILALINAKRFNTAAILIYHLCDANFYTPTTLGFIPNYNTTLLHEGDLEPDLVHMDTLVEVCKKWPQLTYKVLNTMSKAPKNIVYIQKLIPHLQTSAEAGHRRSKVTIVLLKMLGLFSEEEQDLDNLYLEWAQGLVCREAGLTKNEENFNHFHMLGLKNYADIISGKKLPKILAYFSLKSARRNCFNIPYDPIHAYTFYKKLLVLAEKLGDKEIIMHVKASMWDPEFLFKLGESYQLLGRFGKAVKVYKMILNIHKTTDHLVQDKATANLNYACEATSRIAMLWTDRFERFNKNPEKDPELCLSMAEKFMRNGEYANAYRILAVIPEESNLYASAQNLLKLVSHYKKEYDKDTPFVSRQVIVEFILPHYKKAEAKGDKVAIRMLQELEKELANLKLNKSGGYDASFVKGIGKITTDIDELNSNYGHAA